MVPCRKGRVTKCDDVACSRSVEAERGNGMDVAKGWAGFGKAIIGASPGNRAQNFFLDQDG